MNKLNVAVTGANGFLGSAIVEALVQRGHHVRAITRAHEAFDDKVENVQAGNLLEADLVGLTARMNVIVNCAARVHVKAEQPDATAFEAHDRMNRKFAVDLASAAKSNGAQRFVQISSVAAVSSRSGCGEVISDDVAPHPTSPYGIAKLAADNELAAMSGPDFSTISLRPPAIFGPGVGAWFAMLDRAARAGLPLPLGRINNWRSFVYVANVADAAARAAECEVAGAFIVTDSNPLSTAALYRRLLLLHDRPDRVWSWPVGATRRLARAVLGDRSQSLLGNAAYDGRRFCIAFDWTPPVDFDSGLARTAATRAQDRKR